MRAQGKGERIVPNVDEVQAVVNQALAEAGAPPTRMTPDGVCAFDYRDTMVVLERREPAEALVLSCPLMALGAVGGGLDEAQVLRALLGLNLVSADLMGAALALHPGENAVVLTYALPLDGLDARRLGTTLDRFLLLVDAWTAKLMRADSVAALLESMTGDELEEDEGGADDEPAGAERPPSPQPQQRFVAPGSFA